MNHLENAPDSIRRLLNKITLVVVRFDNNGLLAMSKPCKHCAIYMKYLGIKRVVYSTNNKTLILEKVRNLQCDNHTCSSQKMYHF